MSCASIHFCYQPLASLFFVFGRKRCSGWLFYWKALLLGHSFQDLVWCGLVQFLVASVTIYLISAGSDILTKTESLVIIIVTIITVNYQPQPITQPKKLSLEQISLTQYTTITKQGLPYLGHKNVQKVIVKVILPYSTATAVFLIINLTTTEPKDHAPNMHQSQMPPAVADCICRKNWTST